VDKRGIRGIVSARSAAARTSADHLLNSMAEELPDKGADANNGATGPPATRADAAAR
jgi:hypothetical protein